MKFTESKFKPKISDKSFSSSSVGGALAAGPAVKAEKQEKILTAAQQAFRDAAKGEQAHMDILDTEYWFAVCFCTRADKEKFLASTGLAEIADKHLDGYMVAKKLGVDLPRPKAVFKKSTFSLKKNFAALVD